MRHSTWIPNSRHRSTRLRKFGCERIKSKQYSTQGNTCTPHHYTAYHTLCLLHCTVANVPNYMHCSTRFVNATKSKQHTTPGTYTNTPYSSNTQQYTVLHTHSYTSHCYSSLILLTYRTVSSRQIQPTLPTPYILLYKHYTPVCSSSKHSIVHRTPATYTYTVYSVNRKQQVGPAHSAV